MTVSTEQDTTTTAIDDASALAVALRHRMGDLVDGCWDGDTWEQIAEDATAGMTALADVVPSLRSVTHWTDAEAVDVTARADRRAIAAVRSLEVRIRRARGLPVISVRRRGW